MVIIQLTNGLGNQLFQYALYLKLRSIGCSVKLDIFSAFKTQKYRGKGYQLNKVFDIYPEIASNFEIFSLKSIDNLMLRQLRKINKNIFLSRTHFLEPSFEYCSEIYEVILSDSYIQGYWQSYKYFEDILPDIINGLRFHNTIIESAPIELLSKIVQTNSVSIHVRRGDYVNNVLHGNICDIAYYKHAIYMTESILTKPEYFIFSDDIEWCKKNFDFIDANYVDSTGNSNSDAVDLYLMSRCKHNIIANSTFSLWANYLNVNAHKISIAPQKWFNDPSINTSDLYLKSWIRI